MSLNKTLVTWAQGGAEQSPGSCGKMCGECLFKDGTIPNKDNDVVRDAADCLWIEGRPFYCAHSGAPEGKEPICSGYRYALIYVASTEFQTSLIRKIKEQLKHGNSKKTHLAP